MIQSFSGDQNELPKTAETLAIDRAAFGRPFFVGQEWDKMTPETEKGAAVFPQPLDFPGRGERI